MSKLLTAALGAALAIACTSAVAADNNGAFFINAGVGQAHYHFHRSYLADSPGYKLHDKATAGALRLGYAWRFGANFDYGVEGGYVDFGKSRSDFNTAYEVARSDYSVSGWILGVNGKLRFAEKWYLSARGGWLRARDEEKTRIYYAAFDVVDSNPKVHTSGDGWYGGVGLGYDVAPNFSLGLNYDGYRDSAKLYSYSTDHTVRAYMLTAEYRF